VPAGASGPLPRHEGKAATAVKTGAPGSANVSLSHSVLHGASYRLHAATALVSSVMSSLHAPVALVLPVSLKPTAAPLGIPQVVFRSRVAIL